MELFRLWTWALLCVGFVYIVGIDVRPEIDRYCRDRDRLITSEELDEYLLVDAEINGTLLLECHFCKEADDKRPRIWYFQDRYQTEAEREVELGMDNNMSYNRIHVTPEFSLVIREFDNADAGIYRCHGVEGQEAENKYNYRVEAVYKESAESAVGRGNITDWESYKEINLEPVTTRFAVSRMNDLAEIRDAGITLELVSEWSPWSPCERCVRKRGFKTSRAMCRLKRRIENRTKVALGVSRVMKFFSKSPLLPCRSQLLAEEFPSISRATRDLPEFILEEKCKNCPRVKKSKRDKFKYKKRYTLAQGAHLAIVCPESSMETQVVWRKDALILKKGRGRSFRKKDAEPRVLVDTFSTLYLIDVSNDEEGNYTCYANDVKMMQVRIRVVSKSRLLTQGTATVSGSEPFTNSEPNLEMRRFGNIRRDAPPNRNLGWTAFLRHMGYLGFIFLLTSFCYCAGLFVVCREKDKFKVKDYREIENE